MKKATIAMLLLCCLCLRAQVVVNGGRVLKGRVDASGASATLPHRSGTGSPNARDNCTTVGETYFQTDATAGSNTWACTTTGTPGTWTLQGASSGTTVVYSAWSNVAADCLSSDGATYNSLSCTQSNTIHAFQKKFTIAANHMTAGKRYEIECDFLGTSTATIPNETLTIKVGSTVVYTNVPGGLSTAITNQQFIGRFTLIGTASPGATVEIDAYGNVPAFGASASRNNTDPTTVSVDTTVSQDVTISITYSGTNAGNMIQLRGMRVLEYQ